MFTGIIEAIGRITLVDEKSDINIYVLHANSAFIADINEGDSVSVNGVCLTAYNIENDSFAVDVSKETQKCTTLGNVLNDSNVNLERAVTPSTRLGGHLVSGHVDGIGQLLERKDNDNETIFWVSTPKELAKYISKKGSICLNGVSLTVNEIRDNKHCLTIIPHTLKKTTLGELQINDNINIEVDQIARYLEQLTKYN